jgi:succinyl-diaminopimelate desuccinylase
MSGSADPIALAQALIRCESVTPLEAGALGVLEAALQPLGFACERMKFGEVDNLWARLGAGSPHLCFAGHVDVVPPGDPAAWTHPPFTAALAPDPRTGEPTLWGRGARDMKGAVAAFAAACASYLEAGKPDGSISLLITCDEEGVGVDGTAKVLAALAARGETIDHCLVGEPTNPDALGDMIKIGRRGSINCQIAVTGVQGHAAYPHEAANPVPVLLDILQALRSRRLDEGADGFQPSNLEVTSIDVGNAVTNVIPARATARLNIRFNTHHSGAALRNWIGETVQNSVPAGFRGEAETSIHIVGEPFFTGEGGFTNLVADAVEAETGRRPEFSTTGGTSDARFIRAHAPVCEFGLVGRTIHQVDERAPVAEIQSLARIYESVLRRYFAQPPA